MNTQEKEPYYKRDHTHCPEKESPCGMKGKHICCLCGEKEPEKWEEIRKAVFLRPATLAEAEELWKKVEGKIRLAATGHAFVAIPEEIESIKRQAQSELIDTLRKDVEAMVSSKEMTPPFRIDERGMEMETDAPGFYEERGKNKALFCVLTLLNQHKK